VADRQARADPSTICRSYGASSSGSLAEANWLLDGASERVLDKKILTAPEEWSPNSTGQAKIAKDAKFTV